MLAMNNAPHRPLRLRDLEKTRTLQFGQDLGNFNVTHAQVRAQQELCGTENLWCDYASFVSTLLHSKDSYVIEIFKQ